MNEEKNLRSKIIKLHKKHHLLATNSQKHIFRKTKKVEVDQNVLTEIRHLKKKKNEQRAHHNFVHFQRDIKKLKTLELRKWIRKAKLLQKDNISEEKAKLRQKEIEIFKGLTPQLLAQMALDPSQCSDSDVKQVVNKFRQSTKVKEAMQHYQGDSLKPSRPLPKQQKAPTLTKEKLKQHNEASSSKKAPAAKSEEVEDEEDAASFCSEDYDQKTKEVRAAGSRSESEGDDDSSSADSEAESDFSSSAEEVDDEVMREMARLNAQERQGGSDSESEAPMGMQDVDDDVAYDGSSLFLGSLSGAMKKTSAKKAKPPVKKKSNRPSQRARRREAELKFGKKAKHIQKGEKSELPQPAALRKRTERSERKGERKGEKESQVTPSAKAVPAAATEADPSTHPSWAAAQRRKAQQAAVGAFQGQKITFDDDSD